MCVLLQIHVPPAESGRGRWTHRRAQPGAPQQFFPLHPRCVVCLYFEKFLPIAVQNLPVPLQDVHDGGARSRNLGHLLVQPGQFVQHLFNLQRQRLKDVIAQKGCRIGWSSGRGRCRRSYLVERNQLQVDVVLQVTGLLSQGYVSKQQKKKLIRHQNRTTLVSLCKTGEIPSLTVPGFRSHGWCWEVNLTCCDYKK